MPRYEYLCLTCKDTVIVAHLSDETLDGCPICGATSGLKKLLSNFTTNKKKKKKAITGDITKNFIKDAKKDLRKQKKEMEDKR